MRMTNDLACKRVNGLNLADIRALFRQAVKSRYRILPLNVKRERRIAEQVLFSILDGQKKGGSM